MLTKNTAQTPCKTGAMLPGMLAFALHLLVFNSVVSAQTTDTITNIITGLDTLTVYNSPNGGYVSGHNLFGDISKADVFTTTNSGAVTGAFLLFGVAEFATPGSNITVAVWNNDGAGGAPGTILASETVLISDIAQDITSSQPTYVTFNPPAPFNNTFYLGITFTYAQGDTVALITNSLSNGRPNTAWEQWGDLSWHSYDDSVGGWGLALSHVILAVINGVPCPSITLTTQTTNTSSCGICNGSVSVSPTGGTAPYRFDWSTGATDTMLTGLCAGSYTFTVTDAAGCSATSMAAVNTDSASLSLTTVSADVDCANPDASVTVHVSGGTPPYLFDWNDGTTTPTSDTFSTHTYDSAGVYLVLVTDSANCLQSIFDTIADLRLFINATTQHHAYCNNNNGRLKITASGGVPPYSYTWNTTATTDSLFNLAPGTYSVTVTDNSGCFSTASYTIQAFTNNRLYVYLQSAAPNCSSGGFVEASAFFGTPPYTYQWNTNPVQTTSVATITTGGTYSVTVQDATGCEATGFRIVQSMCSNVATGVIFIDDNQNCILDSTEAPVPGVVVTASGGGRTFYATTNADGEYYVFIDDSGRFNLRATIPSGAVCGTFDVCASPATATYASLGDTSYHNFGLVGTPTYDLAILPAWNTANPGFQKNYAIQYANQSPLPFTGLATVSLVYDSILIFLSTNPPFTTHNPATRTITWDVNNVGQTFQSNTPLRSHFTVPASIPLTYIIRSHFSITPSEEDCDLVDNSLISNEPVRGSFDPNEKEVSPAGGITEADSLLYYTIHFQNTGNDTTHFIVLRDTLAPELDATTVQTTASSHPYSEFAVSDDGLLTWAFNPIFLPDSTTDEPGSQGFVSFIVKKKKGLSIGTEILNKASIYFDYNEPIVTNTVKSTMVDPNFIFDTYRDDVLVKVAPNPFSNMTLISVNGLDTKFDFVLYDVAGKLRKKIISIAGTQFELDSEDLADGIYFFSILSDEKLITSGKVIVTR